MENREVMLNHSYGNLNIILLKLLKIAADGYSHLFFTYSIQKATFSMILNSTFLFAFADSCIKRKVYQTWFW